MANCDLREAGREITLSVMRRKAERGSSPGSAREAGREMTQSDL